MSVDLLREQHIIWNCIKLRFKVQYFVNNNSWQKENLTKRSVLCLFWSFPQCHMLFITRCPAQWIADVKNQWFILFLNSFFWLTTDHTVWIWQTHRQYIFGQLHKFCHFYSSQKILNQTIKIWLKCRLSAWIQEA